MFKTSRSLWATAISIMSRLPEQPSALENRWASGHQASRCVVKRFFHVRSWFSVKDMNYLASDQTMAPLWEERPLPKLPANTRHFFMQLMPWALWKLPVLDWISWQDCPEVIGLFWRCSSSIHDRKIMVLLTLQDLAQDVEVEEFLSKSFEMIRRFATKGRELEA